MSAVVHDRRAALQFGLASTLAGLTTPAVAASAAPDTDAELIRLCAEFDALERQIRSYYAGGANYIQDEDERDARIEPLCEQQERLLPSLVEARAATLDGLRARATTLAIYMPEMADPNVNDDTAGKMVAAILRDLTGGTV